MTQSKKDDSFTIDVSNLKLDDFVNNTGDDVAINLDYAMGANTTYRANDSVSDIVLDNSTTGTFTIDTPNTIDISWIYNNMNIDPDEVEKMCKEYPGLEKVWRNFKAVYDMTLQDWKGKKKAGEIDDDIPF